MPRMHGYGLVLGLLCMSFTCADDAVRITTDGRGKRDPVFLNATGEALLYVQQNTYEFVAGKLFLHSFLNLL